MKDYWYISYYCPNSTAKFGVTTTRISPAVWSVQTSMKLEDGPYIVLYAEKCDIDVYELVKGYME